MLSSKYKLKPKIISLSNSIEMITAISNDISYDEIFTLQLKNYPNSSQSGSPLGPFDVTSSTTKVDTRARARAIAMKIENTAASQSWKLGTFRLDIQPDGRR